MLKRILASVLLISALPAFGKEELTVVELFTSQACPNCPPAHDLAETLAERENLLILSWAVDYWDFMGWEDTFARPEHTERQRAYNVQLGEPGVYTPEMVIDGRMDEVGSRREAVLEKISLAQQADDPRYRVELIEHDDFCLVELFDGSVRSPVTVRAIWYSERESVPIGSGSNSGRKLAYVNVVKASREVGQWRGGRDIFKIPLGEAREHGASHLAVLLEDPETRAILGAARITVP